MSQAPPRPPRTRPNSDNRPSSVAISRLAAEAAVSRRARNVTILDLRGLTTYTDFFVLSTATSDTHAGGVAEVVSERLLELGIKPWHVEGDRGANWLLLDYVDVVVHVFLAEARQFYALERLWADAAVTVIEDDEVDADVEWEAEESERPSLTGYSAMDDIEDDEDHHTDEDE